MIPQRQPNQASCLATSFAMVLGIPVEEIFAELGHDGTEKIFDGLPGVSGLRTFHVQEMVDLCYRRGYAVIKIEARPTRESGGKLWAQPGNYHQRFADYLDKTQGVLCGQILSRWHAVAWTGENIIDPQGLITQLSNLSIQFYLLVARIRGLD